jgi:hypothetical protein
MNCSLPSLGRCTFYEFKGGFKVRTVPADRVRGLLARAGWPISTRDRGLWVRRAAAITWERPADLGILQLAVLHTSLPLCPSHQPKPAICSQVD